MNARFWSISLLGLVLSPFCSAETIRVAAAANLTFALEPVDTAFMLGHPGTTVSATFGASGSLVSQIREGAPYDVFLSADLDFARKLIAAGAADPASLRTFVYGRLALWTVKPGLPMTSIAEVVRNSGVTRLAIANPRTAPYGAAARETLARLGLIEVGVPKLVVAENIAQAAQFVSTGNADAGFVALAMVLAPNLKERGHYLIVPETLYSPLAEGAVLTSTGTTHSAARSYLNFLSSSQARSLFTRFGYRLP